MAEDLRQGDKVRWRSHGGEAVGEVEKKITTDTEAAGRTVRAGHDDPQYLVRSDNSGGEAVHRPGALRKDKPVSGQDDTRRAFGEAVNMTPGELSEWLDSDESKSAGVTFGGQNKSSPGGPESVGHDSGEKILTILRKKKSELTDDDFAHMRKVVGYVKRHRAQRPRQEDVGSSRWRYSLMNWGHDPLKE